MQRRLRCIFAVAGTLAALTWSASASATEEVTPSCPGPGSSGCLLNQTQLEQVGSVASDAYAPGQDQTHPDSQYYTPFTIPGPDSWSVTEFDVLGEFSLPLSQFPGDYPTGINIRVYKDAGGAPGAEVLHLDNVDAPNGPNYVVALSAPFPVLTPGAYWFSAQAAGASWNSDVHEDWLWFVGPSGQPTAAQRAATRAVALPPRPALFGVAGTPVPPTPPIVCGAISADAKYFTPRHPVHSTRLGVRVRLTATVPSDVTATARLRLPGGQVVALGTFTKGVNAFRKLRIPVPAKLQLSHGDRATLFLHTVTTPRAGGACAPDIRDYKIKTRIINIERALAL
jgi:hypothetical protein